MDNEIKEVEIINDLGHKAIAILKNGEVIGFRRDNGISKRR